MKRGQPQNRGLAHAEAKTRHQHPSPSLSSTLGWLLGWLLVLACLLDGSLFVGLLDCLPVSRCCVALPSDTSQELNGRPFSVFLACTFLLETWS